MCLDGVELLPHRVPVSAAMQPPRLMMSSELLSALFRPQRPSHISKGPHWKWAIVAWGPHPERIET